MMNQEAKDKVVNSMRAAMAASAGILLLFSITKSHRTERLPVEALAIDCDKNPRAGDILAIRNSLPESFMLNINDGIETRLITIHQHLGNLAVDTKLPRPEEAGKDLLIFEDGTRLIAGEPSPQDMDHFDSSSQALTVACKDATPRSIIRSIV